MSAFLCGEPHEGSLRFPRAKCTTSILPRKAWRGVNRVHVPESDTGRPPEYGKAIEITLFKELCQIAA